MRESIFLLIIIYQLFMIFMSFYFEVKLFLSILNINVGYNIKKTMVTCIKTCNHVLTV